MSLYNAHMFDKIRVEEITLYKYKSMYSASESRK